MLKNPYINALLASLYIVLIIFVIQGVTSTEKETETLLIPIAMLSIFVLSVAVMAMLFFYLPIKIFLDNKRKEAGVFFLKTLATFACLACIFVLILFSL